MITLMLYQNFSAAFEKFLVSKTVLYLIATIWKTHDSSGVFAAVMTNLLKAFDCISHEFLNRTQTTKVSSSFSELLNLIYCIPQGSIFSSLLFVIYISDLFVVNKEVNVSLLFVIYICHLFVVNKDVNVSNYAVDITRFITGMSFE